MAFIRPFVTPSDTLPVLERIEVEFRLWGGLIETLHTHVYRNVGTVPIPVEYNIPLCGDAIMLSLEANLGGIVRRARAIDLTTSHWEFDWTDDNDSVGIRLQETPDGLVSSSLDSLSPGARLEIRLHQAQRQQWQGHHLELDIPTKLKPFLYPSEGPGFCVTLCLGGRLLTADVECSDHLIKVDTTHWARIVHVLDPEGGPPRLWKETKIKINAPSKCSPEVWVETKDKMSDVMVWFPFTADPAEHSQPQPLQLTVVMNLSSSMQGPASQKAIKALEWILDGLNDRDSANIVVVNDQIHPLYTHIQPVGPALKKEMLLHAQRHGCVGVGTELANALFQSYSQADGSRNDILLLTAGDRGSPRPVIEPLVDSAMASGQRIFILAFNSAVIDLDLNRLARATGGYCESLIPSERNLGHRIGRQLNRMRAARVRVSSSLWPQRNFIDAVAPQYLFSAEGLLVFARFEKPPTGSVFIKCNSETDQRYLHASLGNSYAHANELPRVLPAIANWLRRENCLNETEYGSKYPSEFRHLFTDRNSTLVLVPLGGLPEAEKLILAGNWRLKNTDDQDPSPIARIGRPVFVN